MIKTLAATCLVLMLVSCGPSADEAKEAKAKHEKDSIEQMSDMDKIAAQMESENSNVSSDSLSDSLK